MLSLSGILIHRADSQVYSPPVFDDDPKHFIRIEWKNEVLHYSITKRGLILHEQKKGICANPVSKFVSFARRDEFNPKEFASFIDTFGCLTPFLEGILNDNVIRWASKRLLCLLELKENSSKINENAADETLRMQFKNCLQLLAPPRYITEFENPMSISEIGPDEVYTRSDKNEIAIGVPKPDKFIPEVFLGDDPREDDYEESNFDLTKQRFDHLHKKIDAYNNLPSQWVEDDGTPSGIKGGLFEILETLCLSLGWFAIDKKGIVLLESVQVKRSTKMVTYLNILSRFLIERELGYYTQSIRYRYFFSKDEAVPIFSCLLQLMYFSLLALDYDSKYVDCSHEKCLNKTVQLFNDKIIPCCCSSCRQAAASKRNRDKHKV